MDIEESRFLVVEDDALVGALVASALHKLKAASVDIAENGLLALRHMDSCARMPDVIISDLSMPQIDGVEFIRHLAEKRFSGGIILISSADKRFLRVVVTLAEAHHLNVLGALSKPFTPLLLQNMLARFKGAKDIHAPAPPPPSSVTPEALRTAIEQDQLVPFFQPKIEIRTGVLAGVEALARWQHPEWGLVPPALFIPVAEKHGLIEALTQDILRKTLRQAALWHQNGLRVSFAVNFSALSLSDVTLPDRLEDGLRKAGIDPSFLTLEVTESCLRENITESLETLLRLRLKGIRLSIDDFGTGHSSMEELHRIPFSELKIDRVFVKDAAHDEEARLFLNSAVTLGKKLNLSIVAEGVETQDDWDICAELGCDVIQGFLVGRPMPGEAFADWNNSRPNPLGGTEFRPVPRERAGIKIRA